MGHSQADKAHNRERILREAAAQVRSGGLAAVSVGALMRSVGLTHGGFYNHFTSRDELLAQALEHALADGRQAWQAGDGSAAAARSFDATVRRFLSRSHRDAPATGCAVAALAADVARADAPARAVMATHVDASIAQVAQSLNSQDEGDAMLAVSAMVGALLLSRVHDDPKRSDALLKAVRDRLMALNQAPG